VKVLVTGAAGFIGMHCAERLLARGDEVVGVDNFSPYYSVELKQARLARLERSIREALASQRYRAWRVARRNRFLGRWLAHGEGYPDWTVRLFHRAHASWSNDDVHEAVLTTAELGALDGDLLHDSAEDLATYMAKQNRYSTLHAKALYDQGVRAGYWRLAASPLARFFKFYVLRLGFLDGGPGFAHIMIGCNNAFQKYLKLIELQQAAGRRRAP
jgi:hypothetical protein